MPELPDVETIREYLQATALHQEIAEVHVYAEEVVGLRSPDEMRQRLIGRSFRATRRHGKCFFAGLNEGSEATLLLHFGMTGGLKYFRDAGSEPEYVRVLWGFANGYHLAYQSMRKLGQVSVINDVQQFIDEKELGPDALAPDFGFSEFRASVEDRRAMVKAVLMDQNTMAGLGNVYSDEILFQSSFHPRARARELETQVLKELYKNMRSVLEAAIEHQAQPDQLPQSFIIPHRHPGGACPRCGTKLERVKVYGRTAYFCPYHQRRGSVRST